MKKIIKIIIFILLVSLLNNSNANNINSSAQNRFNSFSYKISKKYNKEERINYFESFNNMLNKALAVKKFNQNQIILINDLIKLSNEYVFNQKLNLLENDKKIILRTNPLLKNFKYFSYNNEHIFKENGIWYTYKFNNYLSFPKGTNVRKADLDYNGINENHTIVFINKNNTIGFINEYTKIKLISDSIIFGIPGKYNFLKEIKDDKKNINQDTDLYFEKLKKLSINLTTGKKEEEKIEIIYEYILENIEYTNSFSLNDYRIFSGINTFINKNGVCEGYVKLFLYMLNFSNLNHSEVIRGYVLDAEDFPKVGHAWIKIGDKYYDPTFDDPIGQSKTRNILEYKYFGLPYDLFYTNRYTFDKIPSFLKETNLSFRKNFIMKRLTPMVHKYRYSGYKILKPLILKLENGIELNKKLDIEDLKKIIPYYEVDNFRFRENGKIKNIKTLKYYTVTAETNIEDLIEQINYDFKGYYFFKWKLENGEYEYRLGYDLKFN